MLVVLDGWGVAPPSPGNAIATARTPALSGLMASHPHTTLRASGEAVGLPRGQMGNSEVGHLNLGAGRVVHQELTRINLAITEGSFATNPALLRACRAAAAGSGRLHLMGLVSRGGVHSHVRHLEALLQLAASAAVPEIYVHAFSDGRDVPPQVAARDLVRLRRVLGRIPGARLAGVVGRYYAMDRDRRWSRLERAHRLITEGAGILSGDAVASVRDSYARGVTDEFIEPIAMAAVQPQARLRPGDHAITFNFRADRMRQLVTALALPFEGFRRSLQLSPGHLTTMTRYDRDFPFAVAFDQQDLSDGLAETISRAGLRQLHLAETEKYAHVTYFFNGGREEAWPGEERVMVPSPQVATYDLEPAMSAAGVTRELLSHLRERSFDVAVVNYANADMVGHSGDLRATVSAVEVVDGCLATVAAAVEASGGVLAVTADHGNAEAKIAGDGSPLTAHTSNRVPLLVAGGPPGRLSAGGALCDVAPTILDLLELAQPAAMTGRSLLRGH